jgi:hypothetical protein
MSAMADSLAPRLTVQTVLDRDYHTEIFAGLRAAGLSVFHVLLDAEEGPVPGDA